MTGRDGDRRGGLSLVRLEFACFGKGTPAPIDMPKVLVMRGLDRLSEESRCT